MQYSPESEAAQTGDYVGVESCIDLRNAEDFEAYARECERSYERRRRMRKAERAVDRRREVREFPPPITSLARTENLSWRMPWVMKRYHTEDGRLVIREERVRHHEYFRAHRADGRLTLQLIPLNVDDDTDDGDVEDCCSVGRDDVQSCTYLDVDDSGSSELRIEVEEEKEGGGGEEEEEEDEKEVVDVEDEMKLQLGADAESIMAAPVMVASLSMSALCINEGINSSGGFGGGSSGLLTSASASCLTASGGGGGGKKCYGFHSVRSSSASSLFHLSVPALRPVIS